MCPQLSLYGILFACFIFNQSPHTGATVAANTLHVVSHLEGMRNGKIENAARTKRFFHGLPRSHVGDTYFFNNLRIVKRYLTGKKF